MPDSYSSEQIRARVGYTEGLIEIDGNTIYFEAAGHGPALFFLHDGVVHSRAFDEAFIFFAEHFTAIRYDRPGYGQSKPPAREYSNVHLQHSFFDVLGLKQALLIGGSAGGGLAIDFALAHPGRVKGLILIGAALTGYEYSEHMITRGRKQPYPESTEAWRLFWANDPWFTSAKFPSARQRLLDLLAESPQNLEFYDVPVLEEPSALHRLAEIQVPVLHFIGEDDIADNQAVAGILQFALPDSERKLIGNSGHLVYLEQPNIFNQLAREWIKHKKLD